MKFQRVIDCDQTKMQFLQYCMLEQLGITTGNNNLRHFEMNQFQSTLGLKEKTASASCLLSLATVIVHPSFSTKTK